MATDNTTPWIPDHPSLPPSQLSSEADTVPYPVTRTGAQIVFGPDRTVLHRNEGFGLVLELVGFFLGAFAVGGYGFFYFREEVEPPDSFLAGVLLLLVVLFGGCAVGGMVGAIPGLLIEKTAKRKRGEKENTVLRVGENHLIHDTWITLRDHADDYDDVLWGIWEDLTELADEAARRQDDVGQAQRQVYNDGIAALAGKISRLCEQRDAAAVDEEAIIDELTAPAEDNELAGLLQRRLTDNTRMWDLIIPDDDTTDSIDNSKEN
jgi:hypothetical protein